MFDWITWSIWLIGLIILIMWIIVPIREFKMLLNKRQELKKKNDAGE